MSVLDTRVNTPAAANTLHAVYLPLSLVRMSIGTRCPFSGTGVNSSGNHSPTFPRGDAPTGSQPYKVTSMQQWLGFWTFALVTAVRLDHPLSPKRDVAGGRFLHQ